MKTCFLRTGTCILASVIIVAGYILDSPSPTEIREFEAHFNRLSNVSKTFACSVDDSSYNRNGLISEEFRWKDFNVHLSPEFDGQARKLIKGALHLLQKSLPCVNFNLFPEGSEQTGDMIYVINGDSCYSYFGRVGGKQNLSLSISGGCFHMYIIVHEFIHALGLNHEQNRSDRDDYVDVFFENITPGLESNFMKVSKRDYSHFGVPYNVKSIMHYASNDFSKNGKPTILEKNGEEIQANKELQETDIIKLQIMYRCFQNSADSRQSM